MRKVMSLASVCQGAVVNHDVDSKVGDVLLSVDHDDRAWSKSCKSFQVLENTVAGTQTSFLTQMSRLRKHQSRDVVALNKHATMSITKEESTFAPNVLQ
jgi:hypothetical protein